MVIATAPEAVPAAAKQPETTTKSSPQNQHDSWYSVNEAKLAEARAEKKWMNDATYFKRVLVSPTACVKMLAHAYSGCEEGLRTGGKPLEVMGMMLGCPHSEFPDALVVVDVFPLPVTGFETRVVADDENVINYMIELSELVEKTRKERLMGWYHSHPFDVDEAHNHCFLSSTDLSTQLAWQNAEDPNGNPFLAVVIDPLRSFAKNRAEVGAFRAYPPTYAPPADQAPDFETVTDEPKCVEKWGACWQRYYELKIEYFMSSKAKTIIDVLNHSFLWARTLGSLPPALEPEHRRRLADRITAKVTDKLRTSGPVGSSSMASAGGHHPSSLMLGGGPFSDLLPASAAASSAAVQGEPSSSSSSGLSLSAGGSVIISGPPAPPQGALPVSPRGSSGGGGVPSGAASSPGVGVVPGSSAASAALVGGDVVVSRGGGAAGEQPLSLSGGSSVAFAEPGGHHRKSAAESVLSKAATAAAGIAVEELHAQLIQATKRHLLHGGQSSSSKHAPRTDGVDVAMMDTSADGNDDKAPAVAAA